MAKQSKKQTKNLYIIVGVFILAALAGYIVSNFSSTTPNYTPSPTPQIQQIKIYSSKSMKFTIEVPTKFQAVEKVNFVSLKDGEDEVTISRIATNFSNLSDYLKDFDTKRTVQIDEENKRENNSLERIEEFKAGPIKKQKIYYFYGDYWIYSLSTSSQSLFPDLDQIAQSFRYTP